MPGVKTNCVDTTGAGDAFVGGVLNSFAMNPDLYKVICNPFPFASSTYYFSFICFTS